MLVLKRKKGESLHIADDIVVTVIEVDGGRVKIGINAPREHRILRGELKPTPPRADHEAALGAEPAEPTLRAVIHVGAST